MASTSNVPSEPPPPYTPVSSSSAPSQQQDPAHLQIPHKTRSGIPPHARRSMEDESRPLPPNWVRQYDSKSHHQFFVDTSSSPPHSIWHHPYDDEAYLSTLSTSERERVKGLHHPMPTRADIEAESSGDDSHSHDESTSTSTSTGGEHLSGTQKFGRKMKDKLTNTTHLEREASRRKRDEEERKMYAQHQHIRRQMSLAAETGQPQLLGRDKDGKEVYIEPPAAYDGGYGMGVGGGGFGGAGFGGGGGAYGGTGNGYGYNPYSTGIYGNPNARYIRPQQPYGRPYGGGFGGGYGLPIGLGLGGGLLMGGLLF